jgi:hypothetical protein
MKTGDLIFSCIGALDDPILAVTQGYRGARVNHVGVYVENAQGQFVLEAFPPEVRVTNLEIYQRRSQLTAEGPIRIMLGRVRTEFRHLIPPAIDFGIRRRNTPYDKLYQTDERSLYCSELIVDMFKTANGGAAFFPEKPMSFRDLNTGEVLRAWVDYYAYFGMEVPEGEPGSNPGDMSLDPKLEIYSVIGPVPGYAGP